MHEITWPPPRASVACGVALDAFIGVQAMILLVHAALGVDFGLLTPAKLERPILLLLAALSLRLGIGGRSRVIDVAGRVTPELTKAWAAVRSRVPAAVIDVCVVVAATRLATFTIGFVANVVFPPLKNRAWEMPFEYRHFVETFAAWDSGWYFDIARNGYYFSKSGQSSVAFFPLYPMLMRAVAWPFGSTDRALWMAGILVSVAAFVAALIVLHRFTDRVFGSREVARRTIIYVAVFPFALFFSRVYAESLFLLTSVLAVSRAYDRRWMQAGMWGALATLCRPNGILIGLPLALMALELHGNPPWRMMAKRLALLLPVPLALVGYSLYTYTLSQDPVAWLSAQSAWGNSIGNPPWGLLLSIISQLVNHGWYEYFFLAPQSPFRLFHGATALLFLMFVPTVFKRFGIPMGAYVLVSLFVPLTASELEGIGRYASVLFPVFMLAGTVESRRVQELIVIVSAQFQALFICLFVTVRPIY